MIHLYMAYNNILTMEQAINQKQAILGLKEEYERLQNQLVGQSLGSTEQENLIQLGKFDMLSKVIKDLEELLK